MYGNFGSGRGSASSRIHYSLVIFVVDASDSYLYDPEANSISMFSAAANLAKISPDLLQSWQSTANVVLVLVWDQTKTSNPYVVSVEAECVAQNVYLAVIGQGLGTTFAGTINLAGCRIRDCKFDGSDSGYAYWFSRLLLHKCHPRLWTHDW